FFRRCAEAGVKGTKIDFMDSESHDRLAFYEDCLRVAARYRVMVNFHGAYKPTGEARTWPNEMTREGVRGLEYNKWDILPPTHYASLPFTRFLAGHGDFTPTTFQPERLKGTTFAQQLAGSVVFTSPILCWADKPDLYLASPAVEFIRHVPTVWDETVVLPGSAIGELAAIARRSGRDWYVGVINGGKAREFTLDFAFLPGGDYRADLFVDAPGEAAKLDVQRDVGVNASTQRVIRLNDGGGFVATIRRNSP
ncbi:MAG TPA: glycoside hydrolase family 97 catalytic domain-containing protein, partial [Phycisphaerae bacterium]|nr:glycoside hydrolase family 97 catalytic domain-containing protein [Phycisphaerae bacterium]